MQDWQEELLRSMETSRCEVDAFQQIQVATLALGFNFCSYGLQLPYPLANPQTIVLNNFPEAWQARYIQQNYQHIDPSVAHCRQKRVPVVWTDELFSPAAALWEEAQAFGLRFGWARSIFDVSGVGGMLTLARDVGPLSATELEAKGIKMGWLASMAHMALSRFLVPKYAVRPQVALTAREIEVMKWSADGKTSGEIASILVLSENTIKFHTKNAIAKLQMPNKTAAVVRAAMLGLLN